MPLSQCNETYLEYNKDHDHPAFRDGLGRGQYCAYDPTKDSCGFVSGAPLLTFLPNTSLPHIISLNSFGVGYICNGTFPEISTRVAYYIPWIESHVWPFDRSM